MGGFVHPKKVWSGPVLSGNWPASVCKAKGNINWSRPASKSVMPRAKALKQLSHGHTAFMRALAISTASVGKFGGVAGAVEYQVLSQACSASASYRCGTL